MSYIINLLEALIVSYGLVELCNIDKKKLFFILNMLVTFSIVNFFDFDFGRIYYITSRSTNNYERIFN